MNNIHYLRNGINYLMTRSLPRVLAIKARFYAALTLLLTYASSNSLMNWVAVLTSYLVLSFLIII
jgi:hypothetical protein